MHVMRVDWCRQYSKSQEDWDQKLHRAAGRQENTKRWQDGVEDSGAHWNTVEVEEVNNSTYAQSENGENDVE